MDLVLGALSERFAHCRIHGNQLSQFELGRSYFNKLDLVSTGNRSDLVVEVICDRQEALQSPDCEEGLACNPPV